MTCKSCGLEKRKVRLTSRERKNMAEAAEALHGYGVIRAHTLRRIMTFLFGGASDPSGGRNR